MSRFNYGFGQETLGQAVKAELDAAAAVEEGDLISSAIEVTWRPAYAVRTAPIEQREYYETVQLLRRQDALPQIDVEVAEHIDELWAEFHATEPVVVEAEVTPLAVRQVGVFAVAGART